MFVSPVRSITGCTFRSDVQTWLMLNLEAPRVSLQYLKDALAHGDREKLIRYVRLHLGDGDEDAGRKEIDKAWVEALTPLLDVPPTDREFILDTIRTRDAATLAHLYFSLHFYLVQRSGEWIHDGHV